MLSPPILLRLAPDRWRIRVLVAQRGERRERYARHHLVGLVPVLRPHVPIACIHGRALL